jgi:hypothetical protein
MTDIRHISGQDNVVADALSRVESATAPPSYNALAASQDSDDKLRTLLGSNTALQLEKLPIPGTTVSIYCDTSARKPQPYVFCTSTQTSLDPSKHQQATHTASLQSTASPAGLKSSLSRNITADTVTQAPLTRWISRLGCPQTITTNQGRQFE